MHKVVLPLTIWGDVVNKNSPLYWGVGHARAFVKGQHARLEADQIAYNADARTISAYGHAKIIRNSGVTSGKWLSFPVEDNKCLITSKDAGVAQVLLRANK